MSYCYEDITVFIFCGGAAASPVRTLDGLQVQTIAPGRVVVVDNQIEPALALDPFFTARTGASMGMVRTPEFFSEGKLRNFGLELCTSPLLLGIDANLIPPPDWVEMMLAALTPQCKCLSPKSGKIAGVGGRISWLLPDEHQNETEDFDMGESHSTDPELIWSGNAIFRVDMLREAGGFDPELGGAELGRDLVRRLRGIDGALLYMPEIRCGRFL